MAKKRKKGRRKPIHPIQRGKPAKRVHDAKPFRVRKASRIYRAFPIETPPKKLFDPPRISALRRMEEQFEMALSRPKVSVVIANRNGVDFLWHCLFALKTQSTLPYEIILVDNASEDASVSFVKTNYPQVKILECQENFGLAMGVNLGAKTAMGDLVAVVGTGVVVPPNWLGHLVKDFQKNWPRIGVMSSSLDEKQGAGGEGKSANQTLNFMGLPIEGFWAEPLEVFCPESGGLIYPRFLAPDGPFDSDYSQYQEDVYLGWKFRLGRHRAGKSLEAKIFRKSDEETPEEPAWKAIYFKTRNRWMNLLIFYEAGTLVKIGPWILAEALVRLLASLGIGFGSFWGNLSAVFWICFHPSLILKKRGAIQDKRQVRDGDILKYMSGRVVRDRGGLSRVLNFFSLVYCRIAGLRVLEWQ
jgi:GT2 family glycosyltransferase